MNNVFDGSWFVKLALVMWLVSSVFVVFLLGRIDGIVHGRLYDFGLSFSYDWAVPYWTSLRLIYVCLAFPAFLTVGIFVFGFWSYLRGGRVVVRRVEKRTVKQAKVSGDVVRGSMLFACSRCGKRFSRPILMLDFSGGRARLVNVCPFCGARLGENGGEVEFEVGFGEEEVVRDEK